MTTLMCPLLILIRLTASNTSAPTVHDLSHTSGHQLLHQFHQTGNTNSASFVISERQLQEVHGEVVHEAEAPHVEEHHHAVSNVTGAECNPAYCAHSDEHCDSRPCALSACLPVPCHPDQQLGNSSCSMLSGSGFDSAYYMCGLPECVPVTCEHDEHGCTPVSCDTEDRVDEEVDPCDAGHHGDDGLKFWPFLLVMLLVSVLVTSSLKALSNGVFCGKSINLPFTVVMFVVGFLASRYVQHDHDVGQAMKDSVYHSSILIDSVDAWKNAHPHVILFCLLPPLLFEDAASMEFYTFRKVSHPLAVAAWQQTGVPR